MEFTELLDEYLSAKQAYDEARDACAHHYRFREHNLYTVTRYETARDKLNAAVRVQPPKEGE